MAVDYERMLKEITDIVYNVDSDFTHDREMHHMHPEIKYEENEVDAMDVALSRIYLISHAYRCNACGQKYKLKEK